MTDHETIQQSRDLQEMIQSSKGWKWFLKHLDNEIKQDQDTFLHIPSDEENDYRRFEKQVRLKLLNELRDWADEGISRGRTVEMLNSAREAKQATILGTR